MKRKEVREIFGPTKFVLEEKGKYPLYLDRFTYDIPIEPSTSYKIKSYTISCYYKCAGSPDELIEEVAIIKNRSKGMEEFCSLNKLIDLLNDEVANDLLYHLEFFEKYLVTI